MTGTANVACAEPAWPTARLAGTTGVTLPVAPPGRESVMASAEAVAPPMFWSASGFTSSFPAVSSVGPDLMMVTIGRCRAVVTLGAVAVRVPLNPVPVAVAVALSALPSSAPRRTR